MGESTGNSPSINLRSRHATVLLHVKWGLYRIYGSSHDALVMRLPLQGVSEIAHSL